MAEPYQIRSDFADEIISADIQSKTYEHIEKKNDYIRSNYIKVLCDENELGKHKGDYVSIECRDLDDHVVRENMIDAIQENLQHMSDNMHVTLKKILVVGLGNRFITSDALGPQAANEILVTAHLYEHEDPAYLKGTRNVAVLQPGVMGQTGLESLSIVQSVAQSYQPDLVIAIDALATRNLEVSGEEKQHILQKIQDSNYLNLVVTPKSMDDELKHLVYIVSESLNRFLHPNYEQL